jgi:Mrp family chromosome partitioning ATPase
MPREVVDFLPELDLLEFEAPARIFSRDDTDDLIGFLEESLEGGDGMSLLPEVIHGRYRPSPQLMAGIRRSLEESSVWTLLDEQRIAYNLVRGYVQQSIDTGEKACVIVVGGPGTGKSVIAAHLVVELAHNGHSVAHATGSKAFTTNLRAIARNPRRAAAVFRYFNNFRHLQTERNSVDVIVADEAHRIRETSNDRFTKTSLRSELSQAQELVRAAKVSVFFLDERQNVRPGEIGTVDAIREAAVEEVATISEVRLTGQFRCNGCSGYLNWVDALMSSRPEPAGPWLSAKEYDLRVFDSPGEMEAELLRLARDKATARILAGFCWKWSDPAPDGSLAPDVQIGNWKRPWNEKPPEQQKPPKPPPRADRHPYYLWASAPDRIREIGCIYSAQGFEFDYCGVVLGDDLVWRGSEGWLAQKTASADPALLRARLPQDDLRQLLQQTYRVLLTRGIRGTFVYSTDFETRELIRKLIRN